MLAAASLGAVWSSCSPDFGEQGVLDRFGQIEPVLFIAPRRLLVQRQAERRRRPRSQAVLAKLPTVRKALIVDYLGTAAQAVTAIAARRRARRGARALRSRAESRSSGCRSAHPLYILFSSGTTGMPKCIVHSAGGTLLQHLKEHRLHAGIGDGDRLFYFTTCGWMMWNWLVSGPGLRRDAAALRRLALPSRRQCAVRLRRGREDDLFRHLGEIHRCRCARPGSSRSDTHDLSTRAHDLLDRLAAVAGGFRLRL